VRDNREVLNGIFWIFRTGARWQDLPERFPPYQTCHRRFQQWVRSGVLRSVLEALAEDLRVRGKLDLSECFIDATFAGAKKGDSMWAAPGVVKGAKSWQWQTAMVFLSPSTLPRLSPNELTLVQQTPCSRFTEDAPLRLIGDRGYDSDTLDEKLMREVGIELISPHRRRRKKTQDGRPLRRYKRRWKLERLFAWLHNFRRLVVRWEYHWENFAGMVHLACIVILLRNYL
jgi:transposase